MEIFFNGEVITGIMDWSLDNVIGGAIGTGQICRGVKR